MSFLSALTWTVFAVYLVKEARLDPLQLVLVGTATEVTAFFCEIPTGVVADQYSRRLSVVVGHLLLGVSMFALGFTTNFALIILTQVVSGVGYTFVSGAFAAWLTDEVGEERVGDIFLRSSQIGTLSGLPGIVAGAAIGLLGLGLPLIVGGLLIILLAGAMALLMPETAFQPAPRNPQHNAVQAMFATFELGLRATQGRPLALVVLAVGFFFGAFSEGFDRLWEAHFITNFSFPDLLGNAVPVVVWIGIIRVLGSISGWLAAGLARRRVDTSNIRAIVEALFWVNCLLVGALFGFALAGNFLLALIALELVGVTRTVNGPLYDTWLNQNLDSRVRATVLSMSSQLDALGQFAGGPAVGLLGNSFGIRTALVASACLLTPVIPLFAYASRRAKGQGGALAAEPAELAEVAEVA